MVRRFARSAQRLAWLDGLRMIAAVMILLYHGQLLFTQSRYSPQPTGLRDNVQLLLAGTESLATVSDWIQLLGMPALFGFQFVDVFILLSGFSLTLTTRQRSFDWLRFWQKRFSRLLWPLATVALLAYPALWVVGATGNSSLGHLALLPSGDLLLPMGNLWWSIPLVLGFTLCFPLLYQLMYRWGGRNLMAMSLMVTLVCRAAIGLGGQLVVETPLLPVYLLLANLSSFVIGMVVAQSYKHGRGVLFWPQSKALQVGFGLYTVGFIGQFYTPGWWVGDVVTPLGLTLVCVVLCRWWTSAPWSRRLALNLGKHSYSFCLLHYFVVERTLGLIVNGDGVRYAIAIPLMILGTLVLAAITDAVTPFLQRVMARLWQDIDYLLARKPAVVVPGWVPSVGDTVRYLDQQWAIQAVEILLDDGNYYLCKIANQQQTRWVSQEQLQLMAPTLVAS
ncbi:MAG: acyltransferase [Cyanobacteria bacterium P01_F01_bin.116]